jgi:hypothetical protein
MMEASPNGQRSPYALRRLPGAVLRAARHTLGRILQVLLHDQVRGLSGQVERLGTASVESSNYLGLELQDLDRRLSRIEQDVASLRDAVVPDQPRT